MVKILIIVWLSSFLISLPATLYCLSKESQYLCLKDLAGIFALFIFGPISLVVVLPILLGTFLKHNEIPKIENPFYKEIEGGFKK